MEIKNLTKVYKTEYELVKALDDMSLVFPDKGLVFIVGVSGSGKSTLMNMLSGVDVPSSGEVMIGNKSLFNEDKNHLYGYRNSYVGLIFQDYNLIEDLNVYENIKLPLEFLHYTDFSIVDEVIKKVDIEDIKYSQVNQISSGQMQRVAIARALVKNSSMILADEPTGNLDSKNTKIVMDLLKDISKDRLVVVITHDDDAAHEYGDRIIEIEDGKVLEDNLYNESINEKTEEAKDIEFTKPVVTIKQQLKFTFRFIKNSLARSLAICIMLILIPIIGNVLCGYAFFDISTSYKKYQDEYKSDYVLLAKPVTGYNVYYSDEDYINMIAKYGDVFYEVHSTYIPLTTDELLVDDFYQPVIENIITDNYDRLNFVEGYLPISSNEIAITDYICSAYEYYNGIPLWIGDRLNIAGYNYEICGVVDTNFEEFVNEDFTNDLKRMAFEENLEYYNAVYTSFINYQSMHDNMQYYTEKISYTKMPEQIGDVPEKKEGTILVRNLDRNSTPYLLRGTSSLLNQNNSYGFISDRLWQNVMGRDLSDISLINRAIYTCYGTSKYNLSVRVAGIHRDTSSNLIGIDGEVMIQGSAYQRYVNQSNFCRLLVDKNSPAYSEIVKKENVINPSFTYAKATWVRADSSKYVMIEFLITLVLIICVFAAIIKSMTLNSEKKKIGIKYSFGISKFPIIVPYLLETIFYVLFGFLISILVVRLVYPLLMTGLIYQTKQEILEFQFFYISSGSILGWDLLIYLIMLISLTAMILSICRKSPIEIIKDL